MDVAAEMIADGAAIEVEAAARAGAHQGGDCLALVEIGHALGGYGSGQAMGRPAEGSSDRSSLCTF
jgi:hypothetical protein